MGHHMSLNCVGNIQNQTRVKYEVGYQHKCRDLYQPECRARRAARGLV